jgi:hypothetical protein
MIPRCVGAAIVEIRRAVLLLACRPAGEPNHPAGIDDILHAEEAISRPIMPAQYARLIIAAPRFPAGVAVLSFHAALERANVLMIPEITVRAKRI